MKNKNWGINAREYSVIPWILTLIVVLFVMFIYAGILSFLTSEKILFGENKINVEGSSNEVLFNNLKRILDREIEFRGSKMDVLDAIILHLSDYDLNDDNDVLESKVLSDLIAGLMKERCKRFAILTDFGLISEKGLSSYQNIFLDGGFDFDFYYDGKYIKIKYKEVSCDE